jgi:glycosyltransferase involved in cell wall biosynthesis
MKRTLGNHKRASIWVISPFSDVLNLESPDRYRYICNQLTEKGALVCQFISTFDHAMKRQREVVSCAWHRVGVFELGYSRNVSSRRVISHIVFDLLIFFYFIRELFRSGIPDTIFSVLPHNGAACVAAIFAKVLRTKFIVDIHDTWPESLLGVTKINSLKAIVFYLWRKCADLALICADDVFGESERYANRANAVRKHSRYSKAHSVYIGGDLNYYREIKPAESIPDELKEAQFIISYSGTLGENYDLDCVLTAFADFEKEYPDAGLLLLGGGEREQFLRLRINALNVKAWVSGRIPYRTLLGYLKRSHVGLNTFKSGGNVAYSYKLNDYFLAGVPVINSLIGESAEIISRYGLGINYSAGDPAGLLEAMQLCRSQWIADPRWREKILEFSSHRLDRKTSYLPLIRRCLNGRSATAVDTE